MKREQEHTILPFGPQHPVLPEPLQLKLVLDDEKVVEALPGIGYVHRGLEALVEKKDYIQSVYVVERICGICSVIHAQSYCQGIEDLLHLEIPQRAEYLRVIWAELHRIHSHLLFLGLMADALGFEALFMQAWRLRESILDILEKTTGHRVMVSINCVGGTRRDLTPELIAELLKTVEELEKGLSPLEKTFEKDHTVAARLRGVGVLAGDEALGLGAVGPVLRASGIAQDMRMTGYSAYKSLDFEPVVLRDGDSFARTMLRIKEIYQSAGLIRRAAEKLPEGPFAVKVTGNPDGETIQRLEQPRGEVFYYIKGNGTKNLARLRIRTPTFAHIPALIKMLPGSQLSDVPVIILSIDPCVSCTER